MEIELKTLDTIWKLLKSIDQRLINIEYDISDPLITAESCHDDIQYILGLLEEVF